MEMIELVLFQDEGFLIIKIDEYDLISFGVEYFIVFCLAIGLSSGVAVAVSLLLYYQVSNHLQSFLATSISQILSLYDELISLSL